ncbi:hypothetical protein QJQ45_026792 [Haematococcus lacustris]|nr:hypothetical protein QJQ45_026792 [Haematococcus lacustris]
MEDNSGALVRDDLDALLKVQASPYTSYVRIGVPETALPEDIRGPLSQHPNRAELLEVVMDLGRRPEARFQGVPGGEYLRDAEVTAEDLAAAAAAVGEFGNDNRAGITSTLHRISCIRNRQNGIVGLTCRVGRAVTGHTDMIKDLVESGHSMLLLGRPGVGKTTVVRELARVLADQANKRVVIVDTSNEIGGDGDVPHPAIGNARRMQVPDTNKQHLVMIEAVENHMPQVVIVDEIGTEDEALACRTIAERGVVLIGTAHGRLLENLIKNPTLSDLVGGIQSVTLGDEEAQKRGTQKVIMERKAPPTFPIVVEIRERGLYVAHWVQDSVDAMLAGQEVRVQVRERDPSSHALRVTTQSYAATLEGEGKAVPLGRASYDQDYTDALRSKQAQRHPTLGRPRSPGSAKAQPPAPLFANNIVSSRGLPGSSPSGSDSVSGFESESEDLMQLEGHELQQLMALRRASLLTGVRGGSSTTFVSKVGGGSAARTGAKGSKGRGGR